jgi:hypothetical protein
MSPSRGDGLKEVLARLTELDELRMPLEEDQLLLHLPGYLVGAGEKIVHSNARLAEQLRRLLDEQILAENRRVQDLIQEIKQTALRQLQKGDEQEIWLELESVPQTHLLMERELWEPPRTQTFREQPVMAQETDLQDVDFSGLYQQFVVDELLLRQRIDTLLERKPLVHLSEVLATYPVEKGLAEVLTYCVLAARDPRHLIDSGTSEKITFLSVDRENLFQERLLILPRVSYRRSTIYAE